MKTKRRLQDLTIKDNFMFCAVMSEEENCIGFLEMVLGFSIAKIDVSYERNMVYHPEYKGIRLDVYAKDEANKHYNVEMQVRREISIEKRARYYHSQMDMELLSAGISYEELPDTFVIFICDYDPFGKGLYYYTCRTKCEEDALLEYEDGCRTIYLSTKGKDEEKVPKSLVRFLKFVAADIEQSDQDFEDDYVEQLQKSIHTVKESREMGERYMIFEEMMEEERRVGREEGLQEGLSVGRIEGELQAKKASIYELLEDEGMVSDRLQGEINALSDVEKLKDLLKLAAKSASIEVFEKEAERILSTPENV